MNRRPGSRPHGQIRQSQLITSFGPGSMMDLPNHSVLISGLDSWSTGGDEIVEPRLIEKLKQLFDPPLKVLKLYSPPPDNDDPTAPQTGITAWQFPEWFITQDVDRDASFGMVRARMLVHRKMLTKGKFIDDDRKKRNVVPVRFVRACRSGHIGDIDWYNFVHGGNTECRRQLWIEERGTSGDLAEVYIRCECGNAERSMALAIEQPETMLRCDGKRPWLGPYANEKCGEPNRLLIRTASNAYFTQLMSVISLPDRNVELREAVELVWDFISAVEDVGELKYERKKAKVNAILDGYENEEVFAEIKMRRGQSAGPSKTIKQAEMETLIASKDELGDDKPDGNFFARILPKKIWDMPFKKDVVENWARRPEVQARGMRLLGGYEEWKAEHGGATKKFVEEGGLLPYVLFHSFAHMLITSVSLECGYPASSIRERIYTIPDVGYGVLLYTGSSDAEGTLGGLIQVGRRIHEHIRGALEMGELCSNDPVCAQHEPANQHEHRFLHGAACHGCLLISETSCEQHNEFLDRALVVPTVDNLGLEFFGTR